MLASRILRGLEATATPSSDSDDTDADVRFSQTGLSRLYNAGLLRAIQSPVLVIGIALAFSLGAVGLYTTLPRDLVPKEDRGVAFIPMSAPQGSTQNYTDAQTRIVEKQLKPFQDDGSIQTVYTIIGWGNRPYRGFVVMRLAHWDEREQTQAQIVNKIRPITRRLIGVRAGVALWVGFY